MFNYNIVKKLPIILITFIFLFLLGGCKSVVGEKDYLDMYLVIYDGNGGYLGNKTFTERKLRVEPGSKIPRYVSEYQDDPYVVSSLGLATRDGFTLKGWYLDENATYQEDPNGTYVYLDVNDNDGIYNLNANGEYVYGYVENPDGEFIFISVEEAPADANAETLQYIYYQGKQGYGFYVYDPENAQHKDIYDAEGGYKPSEVSKYGKTFLIFDDLSSEEKTLFKAIVRYNKEFIPYTEADAGLERYSLESGYAEVSAMMELDNNGDFVFVNNMYERYDAENSEHQGLERYKVNEKYKFTSNETYPTPSYMKTYRASITYWNFETERVTKDMTLKAHWIKKCTVVFKQKSGQETTINSKRNPENTGDIDLAPGETIGKLATIPQQGGYTFLCWSKSETEYIPWDFEHDVFPEDTDTITLYAYMVEGTYTRITTPAELSRVANNPNGNYLLCNDIDLQGAKFTNKSPLGFVVQTVAGSTNTPFTGKFLSWGFKISNFNLIVRNSQKLIYADAGIEAVTGLFPFVQNATIEGLKVEDCTVSIDTETLGTNVICNLGSSALIGTALEGTTTVKDCSAEVTFNTTSANVVDCTVFVGDVVAKGAVNCTFINTTATIDYSAIAGITTGTLSVSILN